MYQWMVISLYFSSTQIIHVTTEELTEGNNIMLGSIDQ
uniref:Uncharacterized protein n=1 Tax=Arundo donax TaxID=35708 RepID=A0A0A8YB93_ARUDO